MNVFILGDEFRDCVEVTYNTLGRADLISHSVDKIPYTEDFERLFVRVSREFPCTRCEVYDTLLNLRKQGKCPAPNGRRLKAEEQPLLN